MSDGKKFRGQGWGITVLRVVIGTIFLVRGGEKLFIRGTSAVASDIAGNLDQLGGSPLLAPITIVVILVELVGGVALVLGLFTRWVSVTLAIGMLADVLLVHLSDGFFIKEGGYEYALLRLAGCVTVALAGPGEAALGSAFRKTPL
jgi:putative oxidoreductase